jgi:uncharacterized RDD family membrane protein YckC
MTSADNAQADSAAGSARRSDVAALQGRPAGVVTRFIAAIVDFVVVVVAVGGIYAAIAGFAFVVRPRSFHWPDNLGWSVPGIGVVVAMPYLVVAWCASGRTCGDVLFGLRVVSTHGRRLRVPRAGLRALLCLIFPLGLLWIPFSAKRRSIQDVLLRTKVIYDWAAAQPVPRPALPAAHPRSPG